MAFMRRACTLAACLVLAIVLLTYRSRFSGPFHGAPLPLYQHADAAYDRATANLTVNVVIASLYKDNISWTRKLRLPNLNIIRYISDSTTAEYRPPVPKKGHEAMIFLTYFHDFYDNLPDISIMIHSQEDPWHIEGVLQQSMIFTLSHLDLEQVMQRRYANLRVLWENACPEWLNTTKSPEESDKQEEPFMREAFLANFGPDLQVPEMLGGPCCSQFAVTKEAIRRHPKSQYKKNLDWLVQTEWPDYISGRTWEHMFPWLFAERAKDCPVEWKTYCRDYHICFEDPRASPRYNLLWKEKESLREDTEFLRELVNPHAGAKARKRIKEIEAILRAEILVALERGKDEKIREAAGDLWVL